MMLLVEKSPNHGHGAKFRNLANFTTQRSWEPQIWQLRRLRVFQKRWIVLPPLV